MAQHVKSQPHSVRCRIRRHLARFFASATALCLAAATTLVMAPPGAAAVQSPVVVDGPALALTPFVQLEGDAPSTTVDSGGVPLGAIRMLSSNYTPGTTAAPAGQVVSTAAYPNASAVFGSAFGGDGSTTFGVPDLRGRTPIGAGTRPGGTPVALGEKVGSNRVTIGRADMPVAYGGDGSALTRRPPGLGLTYLIRTSGRNASTQYIAFDSLGVVVPYAGTLVPAGWTPADGRLLSTAEHPDLFAVLGTTYGGDGVTTFALPDLRGRAAVQAGCWFSSGCRALGEQFGSESVAITQANLPDALGGSRLNVDNNAPSLALNYLCNVFGIFPARGAPDNTDPVDPFVGEVFLYAGVSIESQATCRGQILSIQNNQALFALLGTTFGGNGQTTFQLPDLQVRTAVGAGTAPGLDTVDYGSQYGSASLPLWASPSVWPDPAVPDAPTGVAAVAGNGQASVSWTAPVSNGGSPLTGYVVTPYIGTTPQTAVVVAATATNATVDGLTNGTSYTFTVAATNAVGAGPASAATDAVVPATVPDAPTGVSASAGFGSARVTWVAPASNGGSPITGYVITPYLGTVALAPRRYDTVALTQLVSDLERGKSYTFTVAATNANGTGLDSLASNAVAPK